MNWRTSNLAAAILWTICGALVFLSCDEGLPPHEVIPQVLVASSGVYQQDPHVILRSGHAVGPGGSLIGGIRNIHDEVLQDSAHVEFVFEIWLKERPDARATVRLDATNLTTSSILRRGILTLGVDSTALVRGQWSHRTDEGTPFWEYASGFTQGGTQTEVYCDSNPLRFVMRGTGRIFEYVGRLDLPEYEFMLSYRIFGLICPQTNSH